MEPVMSAVLEVAEADDSPLVPPDLEGEAESVPEAKPSEAAPQAKVEPEPEAKSEPRAMDFETHYKSDPEFKRFVDDRANAISQRQRDREAKAARKAELIKAVEDPVHSIELNKAELDQLEAEESAASKQVSRVQSDLEALAADEDDGPFYTELWRREGASALNARLHEDPIAGFRWIKKEVRRMAVDARAKESAAALAEAMATEKANKRLADLPAPPSGNGTVVIGDEEFIRLYSAGKSDDHARAAKLLGM